MPKSKFTIALITAFALSPLAQAQITSPKDAYKAIVSVTAYSADGAKLKTGNGTFIGADGTCVANYALLKGAARAEVTDFKGNICAVGRILGASSNYGLVKFTTTGTKKPAYFSIIGESPLVGTTLSAYHYTTSKKIKPLASVVTQVEDYDGYKYYHLSTTGIDSTYTGAPLLTPDCTLAAFFQQADGQTDSITYAIDARFANDLSIGSTSALSADLRDIGIPKALPAREQDALTYIYMLGTADSIIRLTAINDFITAYPDNAEGYVCRASFFAEKKQYALSDKDFQAAFERGDNAKSTMQTDAIHNERSKAIFQKAVYDTQTPYPDWTLQRAYEEAEAAYATKPQPYYLLQQGRCLFADKRYKEAYDKFLRLAEGGNQQRDEASWSALAQAESWFYAARSCELSGGDSLLVIALIDSCVAKCPRPLTTATAQYVLERAQRLQRAGLARRAVLDYNTYEETVGTLNLSSQFFYIREQAELECRMYQQALDDIRTAIARAPSESAYRIEEAIVLLRAGLFKEAVSLCNQLLKTYLPESADVYKILGIAQGELGLKAAARQALTKAKALGDATADAYLQRYK